MGRQFCKLLAMYMISAQNSCGRVLSINNEFFIVTMVLHPCSASLFFCCMYGAVYFIMIPLFFQNCLSLFKINSPLSSTQRAFIDILFLFFIFESQIWNVFTNLSFKLKYITHLLQVFASISRAAYVFFESKSRLCNFYKSIYNPSSFFSLQLLACYSSRLEFVCYQYIGYIGYQSYY